MNDVTQNDMNANVQEGEEHNDRPIEALYGVPVQVSAVLGRVLMPVHQLLKLSQGSVIELDRKIGEPLDIYVNNRLVARGEVVQQGDSFAITMTEMIKNG